MITRRTLILGTAVIAASSSITSCQRTPANALKISMLDGSIPPEVLQRFRKQTAEPVRFQMAAQLQSLYQQLQIWQKPVASSGFSVRRLLPWMNAEATSMPDDLVSIGDYWLESAIAQNLIDPLEIPEKNLEALPAAWQQFASRDAKGQMQNGGQSASSQEISLWAAPYKVQTLVIVYRRDAFPASQNPPFQSWRDLLQPELRQVIALPNHPRLVIGLLQKIQTGSFNGAIESTGGSSADRLADSSTDESRSVGSTLVEQLAEQLAEPFTQLNEQVKTYDSENSLKALVNGDVKVVVAWSGEVAAALNRYRELRVVVPEEGSLLSADMWVRPKGAPMSELAQQWIDFCWQVGPAAQISVAGRGLSPIFLGDDDSVPETLAGGLLPVSTLRNSEPLLPIPATLQMAYFALWQQLRRRA